MRAVVYLRFPRNRDGVADPPPVHWNAAKERELWALLRATSTDLEWRRLAEHFDVPVVHILQQAAWLYEKELGSLRRRMSRIAPSRAGTVAPGTGTRAGFRAGTPSGTGSGSLPGAHGNLPRTMSGTFSGTLGTPQQTPQGTPRGTPQGTPSRPADRGSPAVDYSDDLLSQDISGLHASDSDELPSRRLLSASRVGHFSSDSDSLDGFVVETPADSDTDSTVSQSALEAALMEQSVSDSE